MNNNIKKNSMRISLFFLASLFSGICSAWYGGVYNHGWSGNYHGHEYYGNNHGYYGGGWGGPNIIINVPRPPVYVPQCETVRVCNPYQECWFENHCN